MAESPIHGVLNILKPPGMTSHDAVSFVRRTLGTKRVGHTGTLDPAAAGVLPICVGQATRLVEYLQGGTKEYIAEATFGYETDTCDAVGKTVAEGDAGELNLERLRGVLNGFRGRINQTPPLHSAIKVGGKKLYELAREGNAEIEIPTRDVFISQLLVTKIMDHDRRPRAMLKIECSGGTYIRSLVRDIGRVLGCGATMTFLVRTRSGGFDINGASTLEAIAENPRQAIIPLEEALSWVTSFVWENDEAAIALSQGRVYQSPISWRQLLNAPSYPAKHKVNALLFDTFDGGKNQRGLFWNSRKDIAALASRVEPLSLQQYKPDKVFFLDKNS